MIMTTVILLSLLYSDWLPSYQSFPLPLCPFLCVYKEPQQSYAEDCDDFTISSSILIL